MVPAYRAQGRIEKDGLERLYEETMEWQKAETGAADAGSFDYQSFRSWYHDKTGSDFDPANIDYQTAAPNPKGRYLQRIGEAVNMTRNRFLATVISKELQTYKHVLVVYGNGHHAVLRRAVEAAMGKPVYEGNLSKRKSIAIPLRN